TASVLASGTSTINGSVNISGNFYFGHDSGSIVNNSHIVVTGALNDTFGPASDTFIYGSGTSLEIGGASNAVIVFAQQTPNAGQTVRLDSPDQFTGSFTAERSLDPSETIDLVGVTSAGFDGINTLTYKDASGTHTITVNNVPANEVAKTSSDGHGGF